MRHFGSFLVYAVSLVALGQDVVPYHSQRLPGLSFSVSSEWSVAETFRELGGTGTLTIQLTPTSVLPPLQDPMAAGVQRLLKQADPSYTPTRPGIRLTIIGIGNPAPPSDQPELPLGGGERTIRAPEIPGISLTSRQMIMARPYNITSSDNEHYVTRGEIHGNPEVVLEALNTRNPNDPAAAAVEPSVEQLLGTLVIPYHLFASPSVHQDRTWSTIEQIAGVAYLGAFLVAMGVVLFYTCTAAKAGERVAIRCGAALFYVMYGHLMLAMLLIIGAAAAAIVWTLSLVSSVSHSATCQTVTDLAVLATCLVALLLVGHLLWHIVRSRTVVRQLRAELKRNGVTELATTMQSTARNWVATLIGSDISSPFDHVQFTLRPVVEKRSAYWGTMLLIGVPLARLLDPSQLAAAVKYEAIRCRGSEGALFNCLDTIRSRIALVRAGSQTSRIRRFTDHGVAGLGFRKAMHIAYWRILFQRVFLFPETLLVSILMNVSRLLLEPWCNQFESLCDEHMSSSVGVEYFAKLVLRISVVQMAWEVCPGYRRPNGSVTSMQTFCDEYWEQGRLGVQSTLSRRGSWRPSLAKRLRSVGFEAEQQARVLDSIRALPEYKASPYEMPPDLVADIEKTIFDNAVSTFGH